MSKKRFIDCEVWEKAWFDDLESKYKMFWIYLTTTCNHAGIWIVNFKRANYCLGSDIEKETALKIFSNRITVIDNGKKWFINKFLSFQYGNLTSGKIYDSIMAILVKENIEKEVGSKVGLRWGKVGAIVAPKDKVKDKDKEQYSLIQLFNEVQSKFTKQQLLLKTEFISYWTEKSANGKKERWEKQTVFDVSKRFHNWLNRNISFGKNKDTQPKVEPGKYSKMPEQVVGGDDE